MFSKQIIEGYLRILFAVLVLFFRVLIFGLQVLSLKFLHKTALYLPNRAGRRTPEGTDLRFRILEGNRLYRTLTRKYGKWQLETYYMAYV